MKERPILFSAPMVRAILAGTKTQTRRVVKPQPLNIVPFIGTDNRPTGEFGLCRHHHGVIDQHIRCPYGQPGDRLWVRETFSGPYCMEAQDACAAVPPSKWGESSRIWYWADREPNYGDWTRPRPSIHMPRWASRILLEIVSVRVERLQDISEADAKAEGGTEALPGWWSHEGLQWNDPGARDVYGGTAIDSYRILWESINGPDSWTANPWVWVINFKQVSA